MNNNRYYIDLHVLQTVPPSCVNRDDTGSPKTAVYGGVTRARVSSQAWKHAMREMFKEELGADNVGKRTKKVLDLVTRKVSELSPNDDAEKLARIALANTKLMEIDKEEDESKAKKATNKKKKEPKKELDALFFISDRQAQSLAELVVKGETKTEEYIKALNENPSLDMVLFGRMAASEAKLNYCAASQVAHSISTHEIHNEYDFFTAVDDCKEEHEQGAAHLSTNEFNSSTLYRYANINVEELKKHNGLDIPQIVRMFAEAFIYSMPTGRQNAHANRILPDMIYIAIRRDQPVNLVNAFEKPVCAADGGGFEEESEIAFVKKIEKIFPKFASRPETAYVVSDYDYLNRVAEPISITEMLDKIEEQVAHYLEGGEK